MPIRSRAAKRVVEACGSLLRASDHGGQAMKEWLVYIENEKTVRVTATQCIRSENANHLVFVNDKKEPVGVFDIRKIVGWANAKYANVNPAKSA
jgi:hypothetical protein